MLYSIQKTSDIFPFGQSQFKPVKHQVGRWASRNWGQCRPMSAVISSHWHSFAQHTDSKGLTPQHRRDAWMNMDAHSRITAVLQASLDCTPVSAAPSTPASSAEGCPWSYIPPVSPRTCRGSDTYDRWLSAVMWMYYVSVSDMFSEWFLTCSSRCCCHSNHS